MLMPMGVAWARVAAGGADRWRRPDRAAGAAGARAAQGLIAKTGRFHPQRALLSSSIMSGQIRAAMAARDQAANGDNLSPLEDAPTVTPRPSNGDTGATQKKGTNPPDGSDEPSSGRGRVGDADVRELAWEAYPVGGRRGPSSKRLWDQAWASEIANGASSLAILGAVRAYAGDRKAWGSSSGKPKAAHAWLGEGRWEAFAPAAGVVVAAVGPATTAWAGPAEIREQLVAKHGEAWVGSWFDRATWDGEAVVARTRIAAATLREAFRGTEIVVLDPPALAGRAAG
jgi:hypothetical protein